MQQDHRPTRPIRLFESKKKEKNSSGEGPRGKLVVIYGTPLGKQYHLRPKGVTIGRTERSDIFIEDASFPESTPLSRERTEDLSWRISRVPTGPLSTANSSMCAC